MEEIKMRRNYVGRLTAFVIGAAIGVGVGYISFHNTPEDCQIKSTAQLENVIQQYDSLPATEGLAQPQDLSLQYIVNPEKEFKGLAFTDVTSGTSGVITMSEFLGKKHFNFEYTDLSSVLQDKAAEVKIIPEIKIYEEGK